MLMLVKLLPDFSPVSNPRGEGGMGIPRLAKYNFAGQGRSLCNRINVSWQLLGSACIRDILEFPQEGC